MSNANKTLVTVATYNEFENLPNLVTEIFRYLPDADLLVIDDDSPDGTGQWCAELATREPRVSCLRRAGKLGLGTAIIAGMQAAIEGGYRYVLNMDADFSHHPRYLPDLVAGMDRSGTAAVDCMIGSRYVPGGGAKDWPLRRWVMSRLVNLYARTALGLTPRDCSGAFRCYRVAKLAELDFSQVVSRGYSFQEEILWHLKRLGCRFGETPIVFADRTHGVSKIDGREAWNAMAIIARLGARGLFGRAPRPAPRRTP